MRGFLVALTLSVLTAAPAFSQSDTPAGLWRTIDDKTGKDRSLVRIVDNAGTLEGRVEQILNRQSDDDPGYVCRKCEGERKGQQVIGMVILWGLKRDGQQWGGGEILDPKNGKTYRAKIRLVEGGRKLEVRGYIGISLIGRSQTWIRED